MSQCCNVQHKKIHAYTNIGQYFVIFYAEMNIHDIHMKVLIGCKNLCWHFLLTPCFWPPASNVVVKIPLSYSLFKKWYCQTGFQVKSGVDKFHIICNSAGNWRRKSPCAQTACGKPADIPSAYLAEHNMTRLIDGTLDQKAKYKCKTGTWFSDGLHKVKYSHIFECVIRMEGQIWASLSWTR